MRYCKEKKRKEKKRKEKKRKEKKRKERKKERIWVEHPNFLGRPTTFVRFELSNNLQSNIPTVAFLIGAYYFKQLYYILFFTLQNYSTRKKIWKACKEQLKISLQYYKGPYIDLSRFVDFHKIII